MTTLMHEYAMQEISKKTYPNWRAKDGHYLKLCLEEETRITKTVKTKSSYYKISNDRMINKQHHREWRVYTYCFEVQK